MDWKKEAAEDLQNYRQRKHFLVNIKEQYLALDEDCKSLRAFSTDTPPVQGGVRKTEERLLNNIVKRERLKCAYQAAKTVVDLVDRGLECLREQDREVLTAFYIDRRAGHVERLMEHFCVEQARIYQMKNEALYRFTLAMYGVSEL